MKGHLLLKTRRGEKVLWMQKGDAPKQADYDQLSIKKEKSMYGFR